MIKSFVHKGLEAFFFEGTKKGIQPKHAQRIGDILDLLDAAEEVGDIVISLLNFCRAAGIDPISAARNKLLEVKEKYPVAKVRGSAVRPANKT